jgi:hypothetical protein
MAHCPRDENGQNEKDSCRTQDKEKGDETNVGKGQTQEDKEEEDDDE